MKFIPIVLSVFLLCACSNKNGNQSAVGDQMGTIQFPVSGNDKARRHMERGIKFLHHMTYTEADKEFAAAVEADPDCAIGYWGRAMTIVHPVWPDIPNESRLRAGWELIKEARARSNKTDREHAYIETLAVYFENGWEREEKDRLVELDQAWEKLQKKFPKDVEAACFFALFHLAPARFLPPDSSYRIQRQSGSIVEEVLKQIPDHPGALHYQIHAYDFPALAGRALEMCELYGEVAPDVPHALHMPTHIYTRAGLWDKSIELNLRSAEAARKLDAKAGGPGNAYLHALDYAVYAYLQRGQFKEAESVRDQALSVEGPYIGLNMFSGAFAFAAIPARCALEGQQWEKAAQLEPRQPEWFSWDERFIPQESMVYFARAIGAIRSGNLDSARREIKAHKQLADQIAENFPTTYWDAQAITQQLAVRAWLAFAEERGEEALSMMWEAAELEAVTNKEAVTPGEVLPAGELLGDMLTEMEQYEDAVSAYQAVLERSPNRFYSLYGTGRAAEADGDTKTATRYYELLLALTEDADPEQPRLQHAKSFLAAN
ncbi:MAG: hypothetical protein O7C75_08505 [Verrucomicrobia bacterium]|nr:hypothetical protein [Verrucomicrobiota bacterium]